MIGQGQIICSCLIKQSGSELKSIEVAKTNDRDNQMLKQE